ncbi:hypothetical protein DTO166G4_819 [Paecilomyces variotii]|uniref:Uncharacterized protein n=1 Tax=Byssochlamys spectabilis TaxID=264951 RepID=A0A443I4W9_BYSSP|nr:hypothetical protein C8Q69DRAFT_502626 [Paecilomyces variotii]KAJ9203614.1 hypothetical protein DTO164E3_2536 [Paecilomyces variotii]KAJ9206956.1 hypothetical protein DTO032I3_1544 [Paecilomyces variotii]KAJ9217637.1 hypothetical protein DTO166G4_819 [Paecilomyces variotii]KAJ9226424.1 hypothetical protein DTO169C6_1152 [Paecilomyces variotii]KAJ9238586.1 hypothetical protein DTO169E5_4786 [Paecilomyces variotii]
MAYKTNYELYSDRTPYINRPPPSQELLNPLGTLYPHVSALQQSPVYPPEWYSGENGLGHWAGAYATAEPPSPTNTSFSSSYHDSKKTRLMSRFRRILKRDTRSTNDLRSQYLNNL